MKVGISVRCLTCGKPKAPRGRSIADAMYGYHCCPPFKALGELGCEGYDQEPLVGDLFPGESEEYFGYPVSANGTREESK